MLEAKAFSKGKLKISFVLISGFWISKIEAKIQAKIKIFENQRSEILDISKIDR